MCVSFAIIPTWVWTQTLLLTSWVAFGEVEVWVPNTTLSGVLMISVLEGEELKSQLSCFYQN